MIRKLPSVKYLNASFLYEPATGKLYWKNRPKNHFKRPAAAAKWNKRFAGTEALASGRRYKYGNLNNAYCTAHRVIWKMVTKKEPPKFLDHKDRNKKNNRFDNLRPATFSQNAVNRDRTRANSSGHTGVSWSAVNRNWVVQAGGRAEGRYRGAFSNKRAAIAFRKQIVKETYGEFAP